MAEQPRKVINDPRALQALAHPVRVDLLNHLLAHGPRTASQCAAAMGGSASNYSYHLRHLARFGFVEAMEPDDRRERPWRAAAPGFTLGDPGDDSPAQVAAGQALNATQVDHNARMALAYYRRIDTVAPEWREAANFNTYVLHVSPAELADVCQQIDDLLRPLRAPVRTAAPGDARPAHLALNAFPLPEQPE